MNKCKHCGNLQEEHSEPFGESWKKIQNTDQWLVSKCRKFEAEPKVQ